MAGNERSGRYSHDEQAIARRAQERKQDLARYMEGTDPDDPLKRARIHRTVDAHYQEGLSDSVSAAKCREYLIEQYYGKAVTPVAMEVTMTPEENADEIIRLAAKLKESEQDGTIQ